MKYLCFLAYMFINLVNCRFFVTSDYSLQNQVQYTLFCFYAAVFIKLKLRPDVACTTSGRSKCYIGTHFLLHRNVFYQLTQVAQSANASSSVSRLTEAHHLFTSSPSYIP